jgi:hypothetical protein
LPFALVFDLRLTMRLPKGAIGRVLEAFQSLDLGDPRRKKRLFKTAAKLGKRPRASLPEAMETEADLEGTYRLANNRAVDPKVLFEALAESTARRAEVAGDVLVIHDTTTCAFPDADPAEVGYLNTGKAGFYAHSALVIDASAWRRPLGVAHIETISRKSKSKPPSKPGQGSEFARWDHGVISTEALLSGCRRVCHIADREADSYAFLAAMATRGNRFVVRVTYDRKVRDADNLAAQALPLREHVKTLSGIFEREVPLSRRKPGSAPNVKKAHPPREVRTARLSFAATSVVINAPSYVKAPKTLQLNVVHVIEPAPPEGAEPVEWLLFTTLPVETAEQVATVVDYYRARWTIEEFHKALKTGCEYEEREFETLHALLVILAISIPIACEILWLRSVARQQPNAPATLVLTERQLLVLRQFGSRELPAEPTARDALWAVAGLGGHLKRNGEPGWLVLYRGMQTLLTYEEGYEAGLRARGDL